MLLFLRFQCIAWINQEHVHNCIHDSCQGPRAKVLLYSPFVLKVTRRNIASPATWTKMHNVSVWSYEYDKLTQKKIGHFSRSGPNGENWLQWNCAACLWTVFKTSRFIVLYKSDKVECKQILVMNSCWVFLFAFLRIIVYITVLFQLLLISNLHWMKQGGSGKRASTAVYAVGLGWPVEPVGLNWLEPDGPKGEKTGRGDIDAADALCICTTSCWKCTTSSRIFLISPRITWSTPRDIWSSVCALGVWGLIFWTFVLTAKSIFELKIVSAYLHMTKPTKTKKLILHIYPSKVQGAVFS